MRKSFIVGAILSIMAMSTVNARAQASEPTDVSRKFLPGVNLAGAGFYKVFLKNGRRARHGWNYAYLYPSSKYVPGYRSDWFIKRGMPATRLSFLWERLQHVPGGPLDPAELKRLRTTVEELTGAGAWVIIDLHNYFRYEGKLVGKGKASLADFADVWRRIVHEFKSNPDVAFGLMNEPYDVATSVWVEAANKAIASIREEGSRHFILVSGNGFSATHRWYVVDSGEANATAMLRIKDPIDRIIFEGHVYFDYNSSGQHTSCVSEDISVKRIAPFSKWLKENNKLGFLGEFGASDDPVCLAALANAAKHLLENRDVYVGWAYWAAGPKWPPNWPYLIEPRQYGEPAPQLKAMLPFIPGWKQ